MVINRQPSGIAGIHLLPIRPLVRDEARSHFLQTRRPLLEGCGLWGELHRKLQSELLIRALQILKYDSPGDTIYDQMVNHDQQALSACSLKECRAEERSSR